MGAWLEKYGETIYGTRGGPFMPNRNMASTRKGNTIYVHVLHWPATTLTLPALPKKIVASCAAHRRHGRGPAGTTNGLTIRVAPQDRREIDTIVKLELDGPALDIRPIR